LGGVSDYFALNNQTGAIMIDQSIDFNKSIGIKIKNRRLELKLTQSKLAKRINVTFQQIQKYEKGSNGTSAYRLWEISKALRVSMSYFFPTPMLPNFTIVTHEEILQDKNLNLSPKHWIEKKKDRSLEEPLVLTKEMEVK
jgi:transcriptional regulator with XRE-family HTH domain